MKNADTAIIIPAYNEAPVITATIDSVLKKFSTVICVNDCSSDSTAIEIARTKATLINHPVNLGQGAALQTGIEYALQLPQIEYFVTFDADGQHGVDDVERMLGYIRAHDVDAVLGSRFLGTAQNIRPLKKLILKAAVKFSNFTSGLRLTDAHNGLRVLNRRVAENLNITMPDMAHASEIVHRIAEHKFSYKEIPVTIAYTDYSVSKGQSVMNAVNISFDILLQKVIKK
jgi:glycosyltransferase involved in cell wall biosynthesis